MLDAPTSTHMSVNPHVVGRIKKRHMCAFRSHQPFIDTATTSRSDQKTVLTEKIKTARSCDRHVLHLRNFIGWIARAAAEVGDDRVDFGRVKTSDGQVKFNLGQG